MKADGQPRLGGGFPQGLPRLVPERELDSGGQEHPRPETGLLEVAKLVGRGLGVVDRNEPGADEPIWRARAAPAPPPALAPVGDPPAVRLLAPDPNDPPVRDRRVHPSTAT